jgi:hypothetical protein
MYSFISRVRYFVEISVYAAPVSDRPHRQGSMMAICDSIRDGGSYGCASYIRRQYFTDAYCTLARFRTDLHDLAGTTNRWMHSFTSSADEHRICSVCRLHRVEDES